MVFRAEESQGSFCAKGAKKRWGTTCPRPRRARSMRTQRHQKPRSNRRYHEAMNRGHESESTRLLRRRGRAQIARCLKRCAWWETSGWPPRGVAGWNSGVLQRAVQRRQDGFSCGRPYHRARPTANASPRLLPCGTRIARPPMSIVPSNEARERARLKGNGHMTTTGKGPPPIEFGHSGMYLRWMPVIHCP